MFTRHRQSRSNRRTAIPAQRTSIPLGAGPAAAMAYPLARQQRGDRDW